MRTPTGYASSVAKLPSWPVSELWDEERNAERFLQIADVFLARRGLKSDPGEPMGLMYIDFVKARDNLKPTGPTASNYFNRVLWFALLGYYTWERRNERRQRLATKHTEPSYTPPFDALVEVSDLLETYRPEDRELAQMLMDGYNQTEIGLHFGVTQGAVFHRLKGRMSNWLNSTQGRKTSRKTGRRSKPRR